MSELIKLPTMADLISETEIDQKENALMVILNQPPYKKWLKKHPTVRIKNANGQYEPLMFLPIERVEYILSRIYTKWRWEIKNVHQIANSIVVTGTLFVKNPITKKWDQQDGIGATPIQTDKGAGAMDWNSAKADGVMKAAPSASSYALKNAAQKLGKVFGKDLGRQDEIIYDALLKDKKQPANEDYLRQKALVDGIETIEDVEFAEIHVTDKKLIPVLQAKKLKLKK